MRTMALIGLFLPHQAFSRFLQSFYSAKCQFRRREECHPGENTVHGWLFAAAPNGTQQQHNVADTSVTLDQKCLCYCEP
jgi:hypothetical protein